MITSSQAMGTRASFQRLHPRGKSLNLHPWASLFQLSSFAAQIGDSLPGSGSDSWV